MKKLLYVALLAIGVVVMLAPPVMAQEEKPFTIHGEVRSRGEYDANTQDFDKDATADQGSYWPYRIRIAAEGKFTKNVTAWIEFQNGGVWGNNGDPVRDGSAGVADQTVEMYQGNITLDRLWWKNFSARIGRQEIVEGTELMLGDLDFYQGNTFDGMTGNFKLKKGSVMLFYTRINQGKADIFDAGFLPPAEIGPGAGFNTNFFGAYTNWDIKVGTLDIYLMDLKDHTISADVLTFGARWGKDLTNKNGLFWNVEYAQQSGDANATLNAKGNVAEGWIGWNMKSGKNNHRFYARVGMASGDDDATDSDEKGFIPMFGDFHNRLGHGDFFRLAGVSTGLSGGIGDLGIQGVGLGWTGQFTDKHEVGVEAWSFTSDKKNGAGEDKLGTEIDAWYGYNYSRNLSFIGSLSELSPDDGLTGGSPAPDDSVTRIYGNARFRF
jgi:alginate export protein